VTASVEPGPGGGDAKRRAQELLAVAPGARRWALPAAGANCPPHPTPRLPGQEQRQHPVRDHQARVQLRDQGAGDQEDGEPRLHQDGGEALPRQGCRQAAGGRFFWGGRRGCGGRGRRKPGPSRTRPARAARRRHGAAGRAPSAPLGPANAAPLRPPQRSAAPTAAPTRWTRSRRWTRPVRGRAGGQEGGRRQRPRRAAAAGGRLAKTPAAAAAAPAAARCSGHPVLYL
jgi:hypothetical protein